MIISLLYKLNCSREISTIEKIYLHTRNITLIFHAFEIANQLLICLISTMNKMAMHSLLKDELLQLLLVSRVAMQFITSGAKLRNADWLRQDIFS